MTHFALPRSGSPRARARRRHTLTPLVLAIALVLAATCLAACGGSSGAASNTGATTSTGAATITTGGTAGTAGRNSAAFTKYTACLKKNGVSLPTRGAGGAPGAGNGAPGTNGSNGGAPPGQGAGNSKFQKAQAACATLRPAGAGRGFAGRQGGNSAASAAYRNCLKIQGVTAGTSRTGAAFKKAIAACASLRPQPQQATTTTTATS
jgi:hypothetical protein